MHSTTNPRPLNNDHFFPIVSVLPSRCFSFSLGGVTIRQVVLDLGNWFVDGNIFMKSGVFLDGGCV